MGMSGDLETMHLADILQWCKMGGKTGALTIRRNGTVKTVFFDNGMVVSAGSNDPKEYLGQLLIHFGKITESELQQAFESQKKTKIYLGKILVLAGKVSLEDIEKLLRYKINETIYDLFLWEKGAFQFQEGAFSEKDLRIQVELDVDQCIFEGARRFDEMKRYRKVIPNNRVVLALTGEKPPGLDEKPGLKRLLRLVERGKTVEEICLEMRGPVFPILSKLFELMKKKYIMVAGEKKQKGKKKEEVSKGDGQSFENREEEVAYLYETFLAPTKIPLLLIDLEHLESYNLTSEEALSPRGSTASGTSAPLSWSAPSPRWRLYAF